MVTLAPTAAAEGVNPVIRGATVNVVALVAVPPGVAVTLIGPVVALAGTMAVIWVLEFTVQVAGVPLNLTAVAPVKLAPVITTPVPTAPAAGCRRS